MNQRVARVARARARIDDLSAQATRAATIRDTYRSRGWPTGELDETIRGLRAEIDATEDTIGDAPGTRKHWANDIMWTR